MNLFLGLGIAALGFEASFLLDKEESGLFDDWKQFFIICSLGALCFSVGLGLWCTLNRLSDFRATAQIAKRRENGHCKCRLQHLRDSTSRLGKRTWSLFTGQVVFFGIGALSLIVFVCLETI